MPSDNLPMPIPFPEEHNEEERFEIDESKRRAFNAYLDEILPQDPRSPHPFKRFAYSEIVRHSELGLGIITGYRIPDYDREIEGLGVQFVNDGKMGIHRVFTPAETSGIQATGVIFEIRRHDGLSLEDVLRNEGMSGTDTPD